MLCSHTFCLCQTESSHVHIHEMRMNFSLGHSNYVLVQFHCLLHIFRMFLAFSFIAGASLVVAVQAGRQTPLKGEREGEQEKAHAIQRRLRRRKVLLLRVDCNSDALLHSSLHSSVRLPSVAVVVLFSASQILQPMCTDCAFPAGR